MKKCYPVTGMACSACSAHVEKTLAALEGVDSVTVSLNTRQAWVDFRPETITPEALKSAVQGIGYDLIIEDGADVEAADRRGYRSLLRQTVLAWCLALLVMAFSMGWISAGSEAAARQTCLLLALCAMLFPGRQFYVRAFRQLAHRTMSMDTLVALSTLITFLLSLFNTFWGQRFWSSYGMTAHTFFDAVVMIITFVLTGRLLEERARRATTDGIRRLISLNPKTARLAASHEEVPLSSITPGDVLEVRAGEKIPTDGTVTLADSFMTQGGAYVDESMMTGEPSAVLKQTGDRLMAGTMLSQGTLCVRATAPASDTVLAAMIHRVEEAQAVKTPAQRMADRFAAIFVPVVTCTALLTFLFWWIYGGAQALPQAVMNAVSVLVIACPCAMGLAVPTAISVAVGKAARHQILVKDVTAMERLCRVTRWITDKTGTLTVPNKNIDFTRASDLPFEERETLKPAAAESVKALEKEGVSVWLMSGDKEDAVAYWCRKTGIQHWQSGVTPDDKLQLVQWFHDEGAMVAMMGDGVNDAAALAAADVSVAMGQGTDVAMDVAGITLMSDNLNRLPAAVRLSRKTCSVMRQNLFWAFAYNAVCIPLASGLPRLLGQDFSITPMWASALMAFSSISVLMNSLRLKFIRFD